MQALDVKVVTGGPLDVNTYVVGAQGGDFLLQRADALGVEGVELLHGLRLFL